MVQRGKRIREALRIRLRLLRLKLLIVRRPPDARSPEEMLEEIKRRSKLT